MRIFKIKKPSLNFQSSLRYELIKENKTTYWLMETESRTLFKGVLKNYVVEIADNNSKTNHMKDFIKYSYMLKEAEDFFKTIDKEAILTLYTELDYIYDFLESLDIVCRYSDNEILKDFTVEKSMMGDEVSIWVGDKVKTLNIDCIVAEVIKMFHPV